MPSMSCEVRRQRVEVAAGRDLDDRCRRRPMRFSRVGRVEREELAVVHDRDPVAELVRLLHVVGREQDGLPFGVHLAEDLPQRDPALRVEPGGRLVEEQDRGAGA